MMMDDEYNKYDKYDDEFGSPVLEGGVGEGFDDDEVEDTEEDTDESDDEEQN